MNGARRTKTYASGELNVATGVLTSVATLTTAQSLTDGDLDGGSVLSGGILDLPRSLTVTLSNTTGAFTTDPIVVTGRRGGVVTSANFTPSDADGNETLANAQAFDMISTVDIPAQVLTTATVQVGVRDICAPAKSRFSGIELAAAGTLNVQYSDDSASNTSDAVPVGANAVSLEKRVSPTRVLTDPGLSAPTTVGLTVYID